MTAKAESRLCPAVLEGFLAQLQAQLGLRFRRLAVGFSGGVDSTVLLQLLCQLRDHSQDAGHRVEPVAIHVNHGLHEAADSWEAHCRRCCEQWRVEFRSQRLGPHVAAPVRNLEETARKARYAVFDRLLRIDELLLLAHHQDDQLETFLLRLCRGAGVDGLAAMPVARPLSGGGMLLRPLLQVPREEIQSYARERDLAHIDDPSNTELCRDRNYLRHKVLPGIAARWPQYRQVWQRGIRLSEQARQLNRVLAEEDLGRVAKGNTLCAKTLPQLGSMRACNLLRFWLGAQGLQPPSEACLRNFYSALCHSRSDAAPVMQWSAGQLRRYRKVLYALPDDLPAAPTGNHEWNPDRVLTVAGMGSLSATTAVGAGLRQGGNLTVCFRRGGERCRPAGRRHHMSLKNIFQQRGVPPWLRDRIPMIRRDGELAAAGDLWVCEGQQALSGEAGLQLDWAPPVGLSHR